VRVTPLLTRVVSAAVLLSAMPTGNGAAGAGLVGCLVGRAGPTRQPTFLLVAPLAARAAAATQPPVEPGRGQPAGLEAEEESEGDGGEVGHGESRSFEVGVGGDCPPRRTLPMTIAGTKEELVY